MGSVILALHRVYAAQLLSVETNQLKDFDIDVIITSGAFSFSGESLNIEVVLRFCYCLGFHLKETPLSKDQSVYEIDEQTLKGNATVRDNGRF